MTVVPRRCLSFAWHTPNCQSLLRRVRDYAEVKGDGSIDQDTASKALDLLDVDSVGFDMMDRKLLLAVLHKFDGGPVGIDNLAAAIGEERGTIEDVLEPYLIQQGFFDAYAARTDGDPHCLAALWYAATAECARRGRQCRAF